MSGVRKLVAHVLGAAGVWCTASLLDGRVTTMEWVALGIAVASALGVYAVPNALPADVQAAVDEGMSALAEHTNSAADATDAEIAAEDAKVS